MYVSHEASLADPHERCGTAGPLRPGPAGYPTGCAAREPVAAPTGLRQAHLQVRPRGTTPEPISGVFGRGEAAPTLCTQELGSVGATVGEGLPRRPAAPGRDQSSVFREGSPAAGVRPFSDDSWPTHGRVWAGKRASTPYAMPAASPRSPRGGWCGP